MTACLRLRLSALLAVAGPFAHPAASDAACDDPAPGSGTTVTCTGTVSVPVLAIAGSDHVTVSIGADSRAAFSNLTAPTAFRVDTGSRIVNDGRLSLSGGAATGSNRGAVLVGIGDGNNLIVTARGVIDTTGAFNDAIAANGSGNMLVNHGTIRTAGPNAYGMTAAWGQTNSGQTGNTLLNTGTVTTTGSNARAMSILGGSGTVTNRGMLLTYGNASFAAYMQGNHNSFVNTGSIETRGSGADAVFSNTASAAFTATIENQTGGQIVARQAAAVRTLNGATTVINAGLLQGDAGLAVSMGSGANTLVLQSGSVIRGMADGGGNAATALVLQGSGTADNGFARFATLHMQGDDWRWRGNGAFRNIDLQTGTFHLDSAIGGNTAVRAGAVLAGGGTLTGGVVNSGVVRPGDGTAGGQLTIAGDYTGNHGTLRATGVLSNDDSPVSRLVVSGGAIRGVTTIMLTNAGGTGGLTASDGIAMVRAIGGATSAPDAFALSGGSVSAGAYTYYLYRGGVTAGTADSWYLRSTVPPAPPGPPSTTTPNTPNTPNTPDTPNAPPPPDAPGAPIAAPGTPPLPVVPAGSGPVPLYRAEVPVYAEVPAVARELGIQQIGTFHDRQGQQSLLDVRASGMPDVPSPPVSRNLPASWARIWGGRAQQGQRGDVTPAFDGTMTGFQLGQDVYADADSSGHRNHYGAMAAFAHATGDVSGFALGFPGSTVGTLDIDAYTLGLYWTHIGPSGWYTDTVVQGSALTVSPRSIPGVGGGGGLGARTDGTSIATSVEAGVPLTAGSGMTIEPQVQVIWQRVNVDDIADDGVSRVAFRTADGWLVRAGVRVENRVMYRGIVWMPYLRANVVRRFGGTDQTVFAGIDAIGTSVNASSAQFGAGVVAQLSAHGSAYATVSYATNIDGSRENSLFGRLGVRWRW
ncbi:autotransporter outer membrane beta-barrel domain-containing protein [Cupriavidus plantarum]|uniref:autotransporter family protein n=1 Tax=Cupriavidus plantarum TaxID=942865 RepID=UPI000E37FFDB|nr:autotransporter outer membrane beta-barrel domain-containing protein [Cupriavidus plantarum]NYI01145.1 outer membrane autotransporter protein [Cupriavidus plantarum]REE94014.1 outer membrane autotransporter protein [Cupriavidus plantarum]